MESCGSLDRPSIYPKEPELAWEDLRFNLEMNKEMCEHSLQYLLKWWMLPR